MFEGFENKFSYIENLMESRLESLYVELDRIESKLLNEVEFFETKNIDKNNFIKKRLMKIFWIPKAIKKLNKSKYGLIYNEIEWNRTQFVEEEEEEEEENCDSDDSDDHNENFIFFE